MKKNLLTILAFVCCMQFASAANLSLSFNDLYGGDAVDPTTGVITFTSNYWTVAGWNFDQAISKDEYTGVKITFNEAVTTKYLEVKIKYVGVDELSSIPITEGFPVLIANFTSDVEAISFQCSNWSQGDDKFLEDGPYPTITLVEAVLIEPIQTEKEPLLLSEMVCWDKNTVDPATGIITFGLNYNTISWEFGSAKEEETYAGVQIDFAEPIAHGYLELMVKYVGIDNHFNFSLSKGSSSAKVSFIDNVEAIKFQCSNWSQGDDKFLEDGPFPTIKVSEAYLLKKSTNNIQTTTLDNNPLVDVYNIMGVKVRSQVNKEEAIKTLPNGVYIMNNKKVLVSGK